jgi:hypothetical protein
MSTPQQTDTREFLAKKLLLRRILPLVVLFAADDIFPQRYTKFNPLIENDILVCMLWQGLFVGKLFSLVVIEQGFLPDIFGKMKIFF